MRIEEKISDHYFCILLDYFIKQSVKMPETSVKMLLMDEP